MHQRFAPYAFHAACCWTAGWLLALPGGVAQAADAPAPSYVICKAAEPIDLDGRLDEPAWFAAASLGDFQFPWFKAGRREQSVVKLLWDDENLYIACVCEDAHVTARTVEHDGPVPQDDCLEIMVAPDPERPAFYFNVEWNVRGAYVDGHRPNGAEGGRVEWNADGVKVAGAYAGTLNEDADEDRHWIAEVRLPLANFREHMPVFPPRAGVTWRANFNRHGGDVNMQYSQWSSVGTPEPAFHVPSRFGRLEFSERTLPFAGAESARPASP